MPPLPNRFEIERISIPNLSVKESGLELKHTSNLIISVENASDLLLSSIRERLAEACQYNGFKYVRFHGILNDRTLYCNKTKTNGKTTLTLNLYRVFSILDFVLSLGAKPMLELSYLPSCLVPNDYVPDNYLPYNICFPEDDSDWAQLIGNFMNQLVIQYGLTELRTWLFYPWNQPDNFMPAFKQIKQEKFESIYKITYDIIKSTDPGLCVGTPTMMDYQLESGVWFDHFMDFCHENDCIPDFMQYAFYSMVPASSGEPGIPFKSTKVDADALKNSLYHVIKQNKAKWHIKDIYIPEWHFSLGYDELHDTMFGACYVIRNMIENIERISGFGYNMLSDDSDTFVNNYNHFQNAMGMYTYSGIKKPVFYSYLFLSNLGKQMIAQGPGYLITKTDSTINILLCHYIHFSDAYSRGEVFDRTPGSTYNMFDTNTLLRFEIPLTDLSDRLYRLTRISVNREHGSSYDAWLRGMREDSGSMEIDVQMQANLSTKDELNYLEDSAQPLIEKSGIRPKNGCFTLVEELMPLEIRSITIQ